MSFERGDGKEGTGRWERMGRIYRTMGNGRWAMGDDEVYRILLDGDHNTSEAILAKVYRLDRSREWRTCYLLQSYRLSPSSFHPHVSPPVTPAPLLYLSRCSSPLRLPPTFEYLRHSIIVSTQSDYHTTLQRHHHHLQPSCCTHPLLRAYQS